MEPSRLFSPSKQIIHNYVGMGGLGIIMPDTCSIACLVSFRIQVVVCVANLSIVIVSLRVLDSRDDAF